MASSDEAPMELSLTELCAQLQSKQLSPVAAVEAALARIERLNPAVVRSAHWHCSRCSRPRPAGALPAALLPRLDTTAG